MYPMVGYLGFGVAVLVRTGFGKYLTVGHLQLQLQL